ncbi:MAG: hypothetical protein Kow00124_23750 [Anaerolineae bacterium]
MFSLLAQTTPNTLSYMVLGYVLILGTGVVYVATLILRRRSLKREMAIMEQMEE